VALLFEGEGRLTPRSVRGRQRAVRPGGIVVPYRLADPGRMHLTPVPARVERSGGSTVVLGGCDAIGDPPRPAGCAPACDADREAGGAG